jgi:hypothetical protein
MNKANIMAIIADLKIELKQINESKQQIEDSINSLYKVIGKKGQVSDGITPKVTIPAPQITKTTHVMQVDMGVDVIVPSYRVRLVLNNMKGRFLRSELYKNAANDGHGPIAPGTFANIFAKLIKRKAIFCVEGEYGQRNAVYLKADEYEKLNTESPINLTVALREDEK